MTIKINFDNYADAIEPLIQNHLDTGISVQDQIIIALRFYNNLKLKLKPESKLLLVKSPSETSLRYINYEEVNL